MKFTATRIGVESTARSAWQHGHQLLICEGLCTDVSAGTHAFSFKHVLPRPAHVASSQAMTLE